MSPLTNKTSQLPDITIKDLYPHLNDEELKEAEDNLDRYVELVLRIYERVESDPNAYAQFKALTALRPAPRLEERSKLTEHL